MCRPGADTRVRPYTVRRGRCGSFFDVLQPLFEQAHDVVVVQCVEDLPAVAAGAHEAHAAQEPELMRDGGLRQPEDVGEILYTQLGPGERVENADAGRVAEHLERLGERQNGRLAEQPGRRLAEMNI